MNELQLGIIGLGAAGVIGVVAYNKWQEHRHRKVAEQLLKHEHADVLLDEAISDRPAYERAAAATSEEDDLPMVESPPMWADTPAAPVVAVAKPAGRRQEPSLRIEPVIDDVPPVPVDADPGFVPEPAPEPQLESQLEPAPEPEPEPEPPQPMAELPAPAALAAPPPVPRATPAPAPVAAVTDDEGVPAILVSPAIDYVARFELVEAVSGDQLLSSQRELLDRIGKPVGWAGVNERTGQWERVAEEGSYRRLRIGLLLADRRGPLGEADLLTFHGAMQALADEQMAVADLPPREPALAAAITLDQFCANVDIQIGLNLISQGQVFPGTKIRALAEAAGMVLDSSGRFVRCDDDGNVLYTLANQEAAGFSLETMRTLSTHGLMFTLDVPCVSHGDRVFAQMLELARRMAEVLHGVLVDDNRRPLTESMLDPFRRQIGQYQQQLAARGMPAGGPLALRLFS